MELLSKRVVLVTGKGGVGRSTVSAAIAVAAARAGKRVLLTEIGEIGAEDSPLARIFGRVTLPDAVDEIAPGVNATLLQSHLGQEFFLRSVLPVGPLVKAALNSDALRRLLDAAPSFREMGIFNHLLQLLREMHKGAPAHEIVPEHELILVDMPATGHTLALTGLPEVLLRLVPRGPIAELLREGQAYLNDPRKGAAYVVTLPEMLPVSETLELLAGLDKTHMPTGGVILNKMPHDDFTAEERSALKPLLESAAVFGASGFRRVEESQRAIGRLKSELQVPLIEVPELRETGLELVERVATELLRSPAFVAQPTASGGRVA